MKKLIIYIFLLGMLLFSVQSVGAANITVHPGESIQNAVNSASDGDDIIVYDKNKTPYTYKESISIDKKISIKSSGNVTIEAKNTSSAVFTVNSQGSGSSISNFIMTKSSYCIMINNANSCTISNNIISGASLVGIQFYGNMYNSRVIGNKITGLNPNVGNGISFEFGTCTNNTLYGNNISNFLNGIIFNDNSENNTVSNNTVACTGYNGAGIYTTDNARSMIITGNTVTGAEDGIAVQKMGTNIPINFHINGNTLKGNKNGFWIFLSNSTISNNTATQNLVSGLDITGKYNKILNNNASNNGNCGITLAKYLDADYNTVDGNILNNNLAGINSASNYTTLSNNTISNNKNHGLIITADHTKINRNLVQYNKDSGMLVIGTFNTINANTLTNNNIGLLIQKSTDADYNVISNNTVNYNVNGINSGSDVTNFYNNTINYNNETGLIVTGSNCYVVGNSMNFNKDAGLTINGRNNVVVMNRLEQNLYGASFSNYNAAIFLFNSVIGNTYQLYSPDTSGTLNATNNWWGSNNAPSRVYGLFNVNPWIVLRVVSSPNKVIVGNTSNITADLTKNSYGEDTTLLYPGVFVPDGLIVNFNCDGLGCLSTLIGTTFNGLASSIFTGNLNGTSTIVANINNQSLSTVVTILTSTFVTVNSSNGYKGYPVNLTATITDKNDQPIVGRSIRFWVDGTLVGTSTTNINGVATYLYTITQDTGSHTLLAQFLGDTTYAACNGTNSLVVFSNIIPTNITVNPVTGYRGDMVNLTALLKDNRGNPLNGKTVTFYINETNVGTATSNSSGIANYLYIITQTAGKYTIMALFTQDGTYGVCNNTNNLQVNLIPTTITVNPTTGYKGDKINLTATLRDRNSNPITGKIITFKINGTIIGIATTNTSGTASYQYTITQTSGSYTINAQFTQDGIYTENNNVNILQVNPKPTVMTVNSVSGYKGENVDLIAILKDHNGLVVQGKPIIFSINGLVVGSALTDGNGLAVLSINLTAPSGINLARSVNDDSYVITAQFKEDDDYCSSENTNNLIVTLIPSNLSLNSVKGYRGNTVNLVATLRNYNNNPIYNKTIYFYVTDILVGTANTDKNGIASLVYNVTQNIGTYNMVAAFLEDDDYAGESNSNVLQIIPKKTFIQVKPVSTYNGDKTNLTATLTDETNNPMVDRAVNFIINGSLVGTATTNINGTATLAYTVLKMSGTYILLAQFIDNIEYASTNNSNSLIVNFIPTKITVKPVSTYYGDRVNLTATLTNTNKNISVAAKTVNFYLNGKFIGTGVTNQFGIASYIYTIKGISGVYSLKAELKQTTIYMGSSNTNSLTVKKILTKLTTATVSGRKYSNVKLTTTLTNTHTNTRLSNRTVSFYVNGKYLGTATTNKYGTATFYYKIKLNKGRYSLATKYKTNSIYNGSTSTNVLKVT